jgi:hypothetical protein
MDQPDPNSMLCTVERIALSVFPVVNTLLGAFLVARRVRADRERRVVECEWCRAHHKRFKDLHQIPRGQVRPRLP